MLKAKFKMDKAKGKSNFTRSRKRLLLLLEQEDLPSRREIWHASQNMDSCMEIVIEVLANFSEFYINNKELQHANIVISEMEKVKGEFYKTYELAREYLDSRSDDRSSVASIDFDRMNIINEDSETHRKEPEIIFDLTFSEVGALDQISSSRGAILQPIKPTPCHITNESHPVQFVSSNIQGSREFENNATNHLAEHKQKISVNTEKAVANETGLIRVGKLRF